MKVLRANRRSTVKVTTDRLPPGGVYIDAPIASPPGSSGVDTPVIGRTIDETGRDVNERPQPEPEQIRTGWYWTGTHVVWVAGPTSNGRGVHYQTAGIGSNWLPMRNTAHWQRVHERVQESGQRFNWRPPAPNH